MPGRPPKPTSLHIVQGTARKKRMEARKGELVLEAAMPAAPDWMPAEAQREWGRVTSLSKYVRALSEVDRAMLVTYCLIWAEIADHVRATGSSIGIQSARLTVFSNIAAKLGMNPSDRVKIRVPDEDKPANKFAALGS